MELMIVVSAIFLLAVLLVAQYLQRPVPIIPSPQPPCQCHCQCQSPNTERIMDSPIILYMGMAIVFLLILLMCALIAIAQMLPRLGSGLVITGKGQKGVKGATQLSLTA